MTRPDPAPFDPFAPANKPDTNERDPGANRFGLHPLVITLVVIYFLLLIGGSVGVSIWRDRPELVEKLFGSVLVSAFVIGVPSWLVWRISRSRLAGNITCALIVSLMLFAFGSAIVTTKNKVQKNEAAMDAFLADSDATHQQQAELLDRAIAGEDVADEMSKRFDENLDRIDRVSAQSSGTQAKVMEAMGQVMRRLQKPLARYNEAADLFMNAGGIDPATLTDAETIAKRLEMADEFDLANDALTATYADLERDMRARLKAMSMSDKEADFLIGKWRQGARPDLMARVRESDRVIAEKSRKMLSILKDNFGRWSYSDDTILFDDDAVLEQYNACAIELDNAAVEQEQAQREIQEAVARLQQASP